MTPAVAQILGVENRVWSFIVTIFTKLARHDDRVYKFAHAQSINCGNWG